MVPESNAICFIGNFVGGVDRQNKRLKKSVQDFYKKLLVPVYELISPTNLPSEIKDSLRCCFKDIYFTLKIHVMFYRRIDKTLKESEDEVRNPDSRSAEKKKQLPNQESAVHPESKASKMVGRETTRKKYEAIDRKQVS